ncbi:MAG TPA: LacI family transcriptional regulator, partial [Spirochaetia bacterium]|nr:LacI family transcriptional regulator [Spirochaetia bacterium]
MTDRTPDGGGSAHRSRTSLSGKKIGFFVHNIHDDYGFPLWLGARDAALEEGVRPICFCGGDLGGNLPANIVFEQAGKDNVDGLVFVGGIMCNRIGVDAYARYIERYRPLPMASIVVPLPGIPSVMGENEQGTREAITHLVKAHGRKRIVFVAGPKDNNEANLRLLSYQRTLRELGLPVDEALISEPGYFDDASGRRAIELFLDTRKVKFDGLFAANDNMAIAAMESLLERGIDVPGEVSVIGFDDQTVSRYTT